MLMAVVKAQDILEVENFGYSGTYRQVGELSDIFSDRCSCTLDTSTTAFSGKNAPLNEEVSVHFRGPLTLSKYGYYVSKSYSVDGSGNSDWSRLAYYDAESQTTDNVTFLTRAGKNSSCLGLGLTYADSDGVSKADKATVLAQGALINSNDEYVIFSNISCGASKLNGDCGVYRSDIPAYHGFYGTTKMFLFEFTMPEESHLENGTVSNWNMPAIWLLNAHIPRTSQYSNNVNCSCWRSGCGEFDIFEVKNLTSDQVNKLYTTIHDYQGTDDIESGLQINGHFDRDTSGTMTGGVIFDDSGNAVVFLSDSLGFNATISADDLLSEIRQLGTPAELQLSSVAPASSTSATSSKGSDGSQLTTSWLVGFLGLIGAFIF